MKLYELTAEYLQLQEMIEDPDCDEAIIMDTLEAIDGEIEAKADGYAKILAVINAEAEVLKKEADRLTARRRTIENRADRLKSYLQDAMNATGKTKFKTDMFSFAIQKNPPVVVIDAASTDHMPGEYIVIQAPTWNKTAIREALKAGKDLTGIAHLEQGESLRIR